MAFDEPGLRMSINMIDTPGLNDTKGATLPMTDLLHLTGALKKIKELPGGHLHAVIYVIKHSSPFNGGFIKSFDMYMSNLVPICNKVIVVHSGYDPLHTLIIGGDYLNLQARIETFNRLFETKDYFHQLDITHLAMNNVPPASQAFPALTAFCYQQRDRLLDMIASKAQQKTRPISTLQVTKPEILLSLAQVRTVPQCAAILKLRSDLLLMNRPFMTRTYPNKPIGIFIDQEIDSLRSNMQAVRKASPTASEVWAAHEELGETKSRISVMRDDLAEMDTMYLVPISNKEDSCSFYFFQPYQQKTIKFENLQYPIRHFDTKHDDNCQVMKGTPTFDSKEASFTCKSYLWRSFTMGATAYTYSRDFYKTKILGLRKAIRAAEKEVKKKEAEMTDCKQQMDQSVEQLKQYERRVTRLTTVKEYMTRSNVSLDMLLKIVEVSDNVTLLNQMILQKQQGLPVDDHTMGKFVAVLFQIYMKHFE
ncbi:hypothetical protein GGF32_002823 [Allomyces javanicus]|nr:hypothetical protein GGF32_002823 [Allomyces javanicus]